MHRADIPIKVVSASLVCLWCINTARGLRHDGAEQAGSLSLLCTHTTHVAATSFSLKLMS